MISRQLIIVLLLLFFSLIFRHFSHQPPVEKMKVEPFTAPSITISSITDSQRKATIVVPTHVKTIREAVEKAKSGDIIYIKEGSYVEKGGLKLKSDLELVGDGADVTNIDLGPMSIDLIAQETELKNIVIKGLSLNTKNGYIRVGGVNNLLIQNCIITGGVYGMQINSSRNVRIVNCTIANLKAGLMIVFPPVDITLRNSILSNNEYGIYVETHATIDPQAFMTSQELDKLAKNLQLDFKLNLFYNDFWNTTDCYNCKKGEFDISKAPEFLDEKKPDFHLKSGSPCIDAGDPDPKYNDPDGSRNDLGALPYGAKRK